MTQGKTKERVGLAHPKNWFYPSVFENRENFSRFKNTRLPYNLDSLQMFTNLLPSINYRTDLRTISSTIAHDLPSSNSGTGNTVTTAHGVPDGPHISGSEHVERDESGFSNLSTSSVSGGSSHSSNNAQSQNSTSKTTNKKKKIVDAAEKARKSYLDKSFAKMRMLFG